MKKKLAVLGASYLQLPLVIKARELGVEVHCFAWDDDKAICKEEADYFYDISVLEKELILKECTKIGIDGILTVATDICIPVISYIAERLQLIGNTIQCAHVTTHKGLMKDCFGEHSIQSPKYLVVKSINDIKLLDLNYPLIVKPVDRSGSLGVVKVNSKSELKIAIQNSLNVSFDKSCIIEEFIDGCEVSVEAISWNGFHQIITITDKQVTEEPYFVELAHHQPSQLSAEIQDRINSLAMKILKATGIEYGASHIELKVRRNGEVYAIEVGSRMGGDFIGSDLVYLSTGFDFLAAVIDVALNRFVNEEIVKNNKFSGVYFLSKNTESLLPLFNGISQPNFDIVKMEVHNQDLKKIKNSNDRSGYLIYQGNEKVELL